MNVDTEEFLANLKAMKLDGLDQQLIGKRVDSNASLCAVLPFFSYF